MRALVRGYLLRMKLSFASALVCCVAGIGCSSSDADLLVGGAGGTGASASHGSNGTGTGTGTTSTGEGGGDPCFGALPAEQDLGTGADPAGGVFTMDQALAGLPEGPGPLRAVIDTELGEITCQFFPEVAPIGVANFIGLARGTRPFQDKTSHHWVLGHRFYDGLIFHRVIDDFVAQGGDPSGNGTGGPGYEFVNEIGDKSHVPGTLAYANAGADTNGSQFYIVAEVAQTGLDGDYTIFGLCDPVTVVKAITEVPTNSADKPIDPIHMTTVRITRCAP